MDSILLLIPECSQRGIVDFRAAMALSLPAGVSGEEFLYQSVCFGPTVTVLGGCNDSWPLATLRVPAVSSSFMSSCHRWDQPSCVTFVHRASL